MRVWPHPRPLAELGMHCCTSALELPSFTVIWCAHTRLGYGRAAQGRWYLCDAAWQLSQGALQLQSQLVRCCKDTSDHIGKKPGHNLITLITQ
eukprot:1161591-Pelagomonas_calceolata.AAC.11